MERPRAFATIVLGLLVSACAPAPVFPPEMMEGVDTHFDFRDMRGGPETRTGKKVHLGGRIIQADVHDTDVVLVVAQLPIVDTPAYGPKETGKRTAEFVVVHRGTIDAHSLQPGNRLILVGTIQEDLTLAVNDVPRRLPSVAAHCLHIWKTGRGDVSDYGIGDAPLEANTFCTTASVGS